ncbi:MAG: AgmX/PglI C-terminal domain-containing protein [Leptospiraceae bacterium]|nr:AgmX/PglI C-terminal domain-containing protein [Leptospiraceae bacterium]
MKQHSVSVTIGLLAVLIIAYLLYRDSMRERQMALLISQSQQQKTKDGGKTIDPYLQNQVKNRIIKGYAELQDCYKEYLDKNPKITDGDVKMDWQIDTDGKVLSPDVILSPLENSFHLCMKKKIANWQFPQPLVQKYIVHTFKGTSKNLHKKR